MLTTTPLPRPNQMFICCPLVLTNNNSHFKWKKPLLYHTCHTHKQRRNTPFKHLHSTTFPLNTKPTIAWWKRRNGNPTPFDKKIFSFNPNRYILSFKRLCQNCLILVPKLESVIRFEPQTRLHMTDLQVLPRYKTDFYSTDTYLMTHNTSF